ncbi:hypothetical protein AB0H28_29610 [Micromonospora sp. NPDC050980]|uniref:hypothetical protein n=1 Tax=Micromonospora sp. NPDC050980 TaxID=3155161 RepID=UPI0033D3CFB1
MSNTDSSPGLPVEFLTTLVIDSGPDTPPTQLAVEQVRVMPDSDSRNTLILVLLQGPLSGSAPEWMLQVAIDQDLRKAPETAYTHDLELAGAALSHPCCADVLLRGTLRRCSATQLAVLGRAGCADALAEAAAQELRSRGTGQQPITPQMLAEPGPAQLVLRESRLHDAVFAAAVDSLPTEPDLSSIKGDAGSDGSRPRWWCKRRPSLDPV